MSRVVVVGAGPAGACLAHLLAHRGIDVTLLERQKDFAREFRGEILMPSGVDVLEQLGLQDRIHDHVPHHDIQSIEVFLNKRSLIQGNLADFGVRMTAISQPALLETLVTEASRSPHFTFERGTAVTGLIVEEGQVAGVVAKRDDTVFELRADLIVGADGRASAVRKHAEINLAHASPPMDIVWCKLACPDGWNGVRAFAGRGHLLVAYHTWDGSLQLGWVILKGTFGDFRSRGIEQWVDEMAHHVTPDLAAHLRENLNAIQRPFLLSTASDCVQSWCKPGLLLIGDAAHTMSPVGGQGVNIALRDAIVAANQLVPVLNRTSIDHTALANALHAIERERMDEVARIQALQARPPKLILTNAWWGEPARRIAGVLLKRAAVQQRAAGIARAFAFGVTNVRLTV